MGDAARKNSGPLGSDDAVVDFFSSEVSRLTGVQLGEKQRAMVESRLNKRSHELGLEGIQDYVEYYRERGQQETTALISLMTTHHTYFFREYSHFEYLEKNVLAKAVVAAKARGDKTVRIWSAACSRGQEVYSLAMFLDFHLKNMAPDVTFETILPPRIAT